MAAVFDDHAGRISALAPGGVQVSAAERFAVGATWRRRSTGALLRITGSRNVASSSRPYFDISWETVEGPPWRRGQSYEEYWLRNCEFVSAPSSLTARLAARPMPDDPDGDGVVTHEVAP